MTILDVASPLPTLIRSMESRDLAFAWETTLKVRKPHLVPWTKWRDAQGEDAMRDMNAPGSRVNVMESDGVIIGFAHVVELTNGFDVLWMLYVKRDLRGFGFGLELLGENGKEGGQFYVHRPNACWRKWAYRRNLRWKES